MNLFSPENLPERFAFSYPAEAGKLSVIIPTGNDAQGIAMTLGSLESQVKKDPNVEVWVVNDGAYQEVSALCRQFSWVREISLQPNRGAYAARNEALRESRGEILAFLDANVVAAPDWSATIRKEMEEADYLAGPIHFPEMKNPGIVELLEILTGFAVESDFKRRGGFTANLAVRREVFEKLGVFEGSIRSGGDSEFGIRVREGACFRRVYSANLMVTHPFRSFGEILRKQRRMAHGRLRLGVMFPDRFPDYKKNLPGILRLALPPRKLNLVGESAPSLTLRQRIGCYGLACLSRVVFAWWLLATDPEAPGYVDPPQKVTRPAGRS